jgi:hypothetical protein
MTLAEILACLDYRLDPEVRLRAALAILALAGGKK